MTTAEASQDSALAYPVPVAASLIGIGPLRAWDLVREGKIHSFVEDGRRLISRQAIEEYAAEQRQGEADAGSDVVTAAEYETQRASFVADTQEPVTASSA
jgi:hypothetical protein